MLLLDLSLNLEYVLMVIRSLIYFGESPCTALKVINSSLNVGHRQLV